MAATAQIPNLDTLTDKFAARLNGLGQGKARERVVMQLNTALSPQQREVRFWELCAAEKFNQADLLLAAGVELDQRLLDRAFLLAIETGKVAQADYLHNKGADLNATDVCGTRANRTYDYPAAHRAARMGQVESLRWLAAHGVDIDQEGSVLDIKGLSPLDVALRYDHTDAVMYFVKERGANPTTLIFDAVQNMSTPPSDVFVGDEPNNKVFLALQSMLAPAMYLGYVDLVKNSAGKFLFEVVSERDFPPVTQAFFTKILNVKPSAPKPARPAPQPRGFWARLFPQPARA